MFRAEVHLARLIAYSSYIWVPIFMSLPDEVHFVIRLMTVLGSVEVSVGRQDHALWYPETECPHGTSRKRIIVGDGTVQVVAKYFTSRHLHILGDTRVSVVILAVAVTDGHKDRAVRRERDPRAVVAGLRGFFKIDERILQRLTVIGEPDPGRPIVFLLMAVLHVVVVDHHVRRMLKVGMQGHAE